MSDKSNNKNKGKKSSKAKMQDKLKQYPFREEKLPKVDPEAAFSGDDGCNLAFINAFDKKKFEEVVVTWCGHPDFLELQDNLNGYKNSEKSSAKAASSFEPYVGCIVVTTHPVIETQYGRCSEYQRGVVRSIVSKELATIEYVDIGSTQQKAVACIFPATEEIMKCPVLCFILKLKDVNIPERRFLMEDFAKFLVRVQMQVVRVRLEKVEYDDVYVTLEANLTKPQQAEPEDLSRKLKGLDISKGESSTKLIWNTKNPINVVELLHELQTWEWEKKLDKVCLKGKTDLEANEIINGKRLEFDDQAISDAIPSVNAESTFPESDHAQILEIQVKRFIEYLERYEVKHNYFPQLGEVFLLLIEMPPNASAIGPGTHGVGKWARYIRPTIESFLHFDSGESLPALPSGKLSGATYTFRPVPVEFFRLVPTNCIMNKKYK